MFRNHVIPRLHAVCGSIALATIMSFLASSLVVEILAEASVIAAVKRAIAWGLLVLVPALALTGITGLVMSGMRPSGLAATKLKRMRFAAANGLLVLVPCALFLAVKAGAGEFDTLFAAVQAVEYAAGAGNLALLGLNMRDGLRLAGRL